MIKVRCRVRNGSRSAARRIGEPVSGFCSGASPDVVAIFDRRPRVRRDVARGVPSATARRCDRGRRLRWPLEKGTAAFGIVSAQSDARCSNCLSRTPRKRADAAQTGGARSARAIIVRPAGLACASRRRTAKADTDAAAISCRRLPSARVYATTSPKTRQGMPGLRSSRRAGYLRDVGTLSGLAARSGAMGIVRVQLRNTAWADPRRATMLLLAKRRDWRPEVQAAQEAARARAKRKRCVASGR